MKKIFTLLIGIVFSITILNAQDAPPQAFSFKATIQGANGQTVVNKLIRLRISILQDDINGFVTYSEYFTPTTNHYSQVDVEIGRGNVLLGIFSAIDWSAHKYYLKVEVDAKGGTNYQLLSVTQLLSVPYALYAGAAGNAFSGNYEDLYNKPTLFDGTWSSLIGKPSLSVIASSGSWNDIIDKPSTLTGYGITDAMSTSHAANGITATNITNWNNAFNWGNHSGLYRPISYVPAWSEIIDKPTFATVATSGSYNDLNNKPTIDGSETEITAGSNVTITGVGTAASPYVINSAGGSGALTLSQVLTFGNDAGYNNIINLNNPVNAQDAVTKAYVDAIMQRVEDLEGLLSGSNISDIDGNIYDIVTIGEQVWMAENLIATKLNDGTPITLVNDLHEWDQNDGSYGKRAPMVCWYDYETSNKNIYGGLYNRYCLERGVCPTGWHVPSAEEWEALIDYIDNMNEPSGPGGAGGPGGKMKSTGTIESGDGLWHRPNDRVTNESGFTGHPGGLVNDYGNRFEELGYTGDWWGYYLGSHGEEVFSVVELRYDFDDVELNTVGRFANPGYSVRCLKD
jgi:uncharacterized protein (TIGR02145 family)